MLPRSGGAAVFERRQLVFGDVLLTIRIDSTHAAPQAAQRLSAAFAEVQRLNGIFSTFDPDSEISRLRRLTKPVRGVKVSQELYRALKRGLELTRATDGFFDLTYEMARPSAASIRLRGGRRVDLLAPDLQINPTGLAKGFIVDAVAARLKRDRRICSAVVAAGGDIARFDKRGGGEKIALANPSRRKQNDGLHVVLGNGSVSTSGFYERGRHIKNTGGGGAEQLQVSVTAPGTVTSDGLAKAMMFMTRRQIAGTLTRFPGTTAVVMEKDGAVATINPGVGD
jgi:thiamine biosynthesis lipoprotein